MRIHLCGVRGSTPAPGPDFVRYGGNTSCLAIAKDAVAAPGLLLDAGTGIRRASDLLEGKAFTGTILLTHLHWDHMQGLPFFRAGDRDDARADLLLPADDDTADPEELLAQGMSPPHFPIRPRELRGIWTFGLAREGTFEAAGLCVTAREIPHKGGKALGYRVEDSAGALAYLPDHCPTELGPGPCGTGVFHEAALALAAGAEVVVHDAYWLPGELNGGRSALGHASADYAVALAERAGAKSVLLFHHRPDRTDAELDEIARRYSAAPLQVRVAAEGEVIQW